MKPDAELKALKRQAAPHFPASAALELPDALRTLRRARRALDDLFAQADHDGVVGAAADYAAASVELHRLWHYLDALLRGARNAVRYGPPRLVAAPTPDGAS